MITHCFKSIFNHGTLPPHDYAWTIIQSFLPEESASALAEHLLEEHRMIINGIFWVLGFGAPWRDFP
ncbi:transposase [Dickeya undicola]|uniref:transposase n=1 Tax=Dickeya undicola TaxID=1577887 RepID=UPI003F213666